MLCNELVICGLIIVLCNCMEPSRTLCHRNHYAATKDYISGIIPGQSCIMKFHCIVIWMPDYLNSWHDPENTLYPMGAEDRV